MTDSFSEFEQRADYQFGCPVGIWVASLDHKGWGKSSNLILYLSDLDTGQKYWFSVFHGNGYRPRSGGLSFKSEGEQGAIFKVTTAKTANGAPVLMDAGKLATNLAEYNTPVLDLAVIDPEGGVHPLTPALVRDSRENMLKKLADLDIESLPTTEEAVARQKARSSPFARLMKNEQ